VSVRIQTQIWSSGLNGTAMLVMQAVADCADDDGFAYPSNSYLSWKTGLSKSTVQATTKMFRDKGYFSVEKTTGGDTSNQVQIVVSSLPTKKQWDRFRGRPAGKSGREKAPSDPTQIPGGVAGTPPRLQGTPPRLEGTPPRLPNPNKEETSGTIKNQDLSPSKKPKERKIPTATNPNTDPRYFKFIDLIDEAHEYFLKSKPLFDSKTGIHLKRILKVRKDLTEAKFRKILGNYHRSDDHVPTVQPGYYVQRLLNYESCAANQYGRPKDAQEALPRSASEILDEQQKG